MGGPTRASSLWLKHKVFFVVTVGEDSRDLDLG